MKTGSLFSETAVEGYSTICTHWAEWAVFNFESATRAVPQVQQSPGIFLVQRKKNRKHFNNLTEQ